MKTLILMRHAKSSWKDAGLADHDRPLSGRGRRSAPVMAGWLRGRGHLPQRILCSSSERTRETVARMRATWPVLPEPVIRPALYHAETPALLAEIKGLSDDIRLAMIVGHEPGLGELTQSLAGPGAPEGCARAFSHFPTAAVAIFEIDGDWETVRTGAAQFVAFAVPRDLMDDAG